LLQQMDKIDLTPICLFLAAIERGEEFVEGLDGQLAMRADAAV